MRQELEQIRKELQRAILSSGEANTDHPLIRARRLLDTLMAREAQEDSKAICTQVELQKENEWKVYWFEAQHGNICVGDRMTFTEEKGVWIVTAICLTLREKDIGVPYRLGTWRSLVRLRVRPVFSLKARRDSNECHINL